jgi:hypothetical protein
VSDLVVHHVELRTKAEDRRPSISLEDAAGASFERVSAAPAPGIKTFQLRNVSGFSLQACPGVADAQREKLVEEDQL